MPGIEGVSAVNEELVGAIAHLVWQLSATAEAPGGGSRGTRGGERTVRACRLERRETNVYRRAL